MRIVVGLGGNALLRRGEPPTLAAQRANARSAAAALAAIRPGNELIITHGNGPQVGSLALRDLAANPTHPTPLDVLNAESEGMIGYILEQELRNALPNEHIATILTTVLVDPASPAFAHPTKFIGPPYDSAEMQRLQQELGWSFRMDGSQWRRVVASPAPLAILQIEPIRTLVQTGHTVIAAGGGGIPVAYDSAGTLAGIQAVIDKDHCSALLARELAADFLLLATDVSAVYEEWGTTHARPIHASTPEELEGHHFAPGSMGPKIDAARDFATQTGKTAAIGAMTELSAILRGEAGTTIKRA